MARMPPPVLCVAEPPDPRRCHPDGSLKIFGPGGNVISQPASVPRPSSSAAASAAFSYPALNTATARQALHVATNDGPPPLPASSGPPPLPASRAPPRPTRPCPLFQRREDIRFISFFNSKCIIYIYIYRFGNILFGYNFMIVLYH